MSFSGLSPTSPCFPERAVPELFAVFQLRQQNGSIALCLLKDEALLTYPSLLFPFVCAMNWRHSFHFAQIIPNCNPVLQRTCSFFYLCVNGTPKKSSLGPVFSKLLPSFLLATLTQHVREMRWTPYSWEEGEGLTPHLPRVESHQSHPVATGLIYIELFKSRVVGRVPIQGSLPPTGKGTSLTTTAT